MDVDDGREIGIADPVIFAGLRRSLDETNRKIALGQIDPSAIERYTISLIARTRCLPRDLNGAAAGVRWVRENRRAGGDCCRHQWTILVWVFCADGFLRSDSKRRTADHSVGGFAVLPQSLIRVRLPPRVPRILRSA